MKPILITLAVLLWLASIIGAFIAGALVDSNAQLRHEELQQMMLRTSALKRGEA